MHVVKTTIRQYIRGGGYEKGDNGLSQKCCTVYPFTADCAVCSVQCTVYSVQCTVYSVQCTGLIVRIYEFMRERGG